MSDRSAQSPATESMRPVFAYSLDPRAREVFPADLQDRAARVGRAINSPGCLPAREKLGEVEVLLGSWHMARLDAELLGAMPRLHTVLYAAGSVRHFMTDAAWQRLRVSSAADANARVVAEFCVAEILFSLKHGWRKSAKALAASPEFPGAPDAAPGIDRTSVVGLVSFGRIARHTSHFLKAFSPRVVAYDPGVPPAEMATAGVEPVSLEELFSRSDVVSVHVPLLDSTRGLIGPALLARLRPGATLINTARGGVIDEGSLIRFLHQRPDVTAVLDVTEPEPPAANSPLRFLPNVVLTPHIAGCVGRECRRLGEAMVEELEAIAAGRPLRHLLTRAEADAQT